MGPSVLRLGVAAPLHLLDGGGDLLPLLLPDAFIPENVVLLRGQGGVHSHDLAESVIHIDPGRLSFIHLDAPKAGPGILQDLADST